MENVTSKVLLDTGKCKACWKCLDVCPQKVIDKINVIVHKHAVMRKREQCIGCLKCVRICPHGAFSTAKLIDDTQIGTVENAMRGRGRGRGRRR
jgi:2-oxoglutarate ferredoxin oxidoreductase subunit delta